MTRPSFRLLLPLLLAGLSGSSPDARQFLRVEIDDGSGSAMLVFTGRNRIRGIETGRMIVVEGVGRIENGRFVIWNPAYTLLDGLVKS